MEKKELWVQNSGTMDVSLSDLGVKVPVGKTVNVYAVNPYITQEKVNQSLSSGSLAKRLGSKTLKLAGGPASPRPATLDHVKESDNPLQVKKTKSSVVVDSVNPDLAEESDGEGFSFADYGVNDVGPNVSQTREGPAVVVKAKQDDDKEEAVSDVVVEPKQTNNVSQQSVVTMETTSKLASHPMGKVAAPSNTMGKTQPFVVFKAPQGEEQQEEVTPTPSIKPIVDETTGVVTTNIGKVAGQRSIELQAELQKLAESMNTTVEELPENLVAALEAERAIKLEETPFDAQAATKTAEGATVMKIKEATEEDTDQ